MAKKTRLFKAARLIPGPGLLALLSLSPSLTGGPAVARDVPAAAPAVDAPRLALAATTTPAAVSQPPSTAGPWAGGPAAALPGGPTNGASSSGAGAAVSPATPAPGNGPSTGRPHRGSVGCLIGPERSADIGSAVTGVVAAIRVDRGDSVRRGQPLVVLQNAVEQANLKAVAARHAIEADIRSAEASVALARERHERFASLVDTGAIALLTAEQAKAEYDVARQRLQQALGQRRVIQQELGVAQAQLAQRTLRAPFDGVVVERLSHEGERVEEKPLLRIAQLDPLRVELVMPASRWGSVQAGHTMRIVPELPGTTALVARVTHIDRTLDAASNTFRVRLALPNPGNRIPAGARCRADAPEDVAAAPAGTLAVGVPPRDAAASASSRDAAAPVPSRDAAARDTTPTGQPVPRRGPAA